MRDVNPLEWPAYFVQVVGQTPDGALLTRGWRDIHGLTPIDTLPFSDPPVKHRRRRAKWAPGTIEPKTFGA